MTLHEGLSPTLWRTCRALANRKRLSILAELLRNPGQSVSSIAALLHLPLPVASRYTRELNARGLLAAQRAGRWVHYRPAADKSVEGTTQLLHALTHVFATEKEPAKLVYRNATAFTHPRRIAILRVLQTGDQTIQALQSKTGISHRALLRHLRKLEDRGFVLTDSAGCRRTQPDSRFATTLLGLACRE